MLVYTIARSEERKSSLFMVIKTIKRLFFKGFTREGCKNETTALSLSDLKTVNAWEETEIDHHKLFNVDLSSTQDNIWSGRKTSLHGEGKKKSLCDLYCVTECQESDVSCVQLCLTDPA